MKKVLFFIGLMGLSSLVDVHGMTDWKFIDKNYTPALEAAVAVDVALSSEGQKEVTINNRKVCIEKSIWKDLDLTRGVRRLSSLFSDAFSVADKLYIASANDGIALYNYMYLADLVSSFFVERSLDRALTFTLGYLLWKGNSDQFGISDVQRTVVSFFDDIDHYTENSSEWNRVKPEQWVVKEWCEALDFCLFKNGWGLLDIYEKYFNDRRMKLQFLKEKYKEHIGL